MHTLDVVLAKPSLSLFFLDMFRMYIESVMYTNNQEATYM